MQHFQRILFPPLFTDMIVSPEHFLPFAHQPYVRTDRSRGPFELWDRRVLQRENGKENVTCGPVPVHADRMGNANSGNDSHCGRRSERSPVYPSSHPNVPPQRPNKRNFAFRKRLKTGASDKWPLENYTRHSKRPSWVCFLSFLGRP